MEVNDRELDEQVSKFFEIPVKKNRCFETMTRVTGKGCVVRVWRTCSAFTVGPDAEVVEALRGVHGVEASAVILDGLDGIGAYEILDTNGNGCVVYPDWS